ncbi:MAG: hypothetical protein VSS52_003445 [Thiotrichaceae bacterium]|nr:hypothetical protein [Thiotrichaceae bacterium]
MKSYSIIALIILAIGLSACSHRPIPVATSYKTSTQQKMQAAHHWNVLAAHVAKRLKDTLDVTFPDINTQPPVHIRFTKDYEEVPFGKAFYHMLRTRLLQKGVVVTTDTEYKDTLLLDFDMQVVRHKDRRLTYPPPGSFSALAGSIWLVSKAIDDWTYPEAALLPFALVADVGLAMDYYLPGETNTEVIISTAVTMGNQYIFGDTGIYYINTDDDDHYFVAGRKFPVVSCSQNSTCP